MSPERTPIAGLDDARSRDAADPLARFRDAFVIDDPTLVYLDGNSLGRLPKRARERVLDVMDGEWGQGLIRSWTHTPTGGSWFSAPERLGDAIGSLLGAAPGQVLVSDSTSVNLFKLAVAALQARPGKHKIVSDQLNFPSDLYVLEGATRLLGGDHRLELAPANAADDGPDLNALNALIDEDTALVSLSHVAFKSGYMYDAAAITERAHRVGALTLWDLSHSAGAVPLRLDAWGVDLAVGCSYKYLNGGPGAPAFYYVRQDLQGSLRSPIQGWFGRSEPFGFDLDYQPVDGAARFLVGTPPVLSTLAIEAGVALLQDAGPDALRAKSVALAGYLIELFDRELAALGFTLASPREPGIRGSHVSLRHPRARHLIGVLLAAGVVPDFREPDLLRFGLTPLYTTFEEVWRAVDRLVSIAQRAELADA